MAAFHRFSHGHHDLVLAVDYNFYGNRMVTASSDHRLKVWDLKDDHWVVTDVWRAHDAEITDVGYDCASSSIFLAEHTRSNGTVHSLDKYWPASVKMDCFVSGKKTSPRVLTLAVVSRRSTSNLQQAESRTCHLTSRI